MQFRRAGWGAGTVLACGVIVAGCTGSGPVTINGTFTGTITNNRSPVIDGIAAVPSSVEAGSAGPVQFTVTAHDEDGHSLTFVSSFSDANGVIAMVTSSVTGSVYVVQYMAPTSAGNGSFHVDVSDGHGGTAAGDLTVPITAPAPPPSGGGGGGSGGGGGTQPPTSITITPRGVPYVRQHGQRAVVSASTNVTDNLLSVVSNTAPVQSSSRWRPTTDSGLAVEIELPRQSVPGPHQVGLAYIGGVTVWGTVIYADPTGVASLTMDDYEGQAFGQVVVTKVTEGLGINAASVPELVTFGSNYELLDASAAAPPENIWKLAQMNGQTGDLKAMLFNESPPGNMLHLLIIGTGVQGLWIRSLPDDPRDAMVFWSEGIGQPIKLTRVGYHGSVDPAYTLNAPGQEVLYQGMVSEPQVFLYARSGEVEAPYALFTSYDDNTATGRYVVLVNLKTGEYSRTDAAIEPKFLRVGTDPVAHRLRYSVAGNNGATQDRPCWQTAVLNGGAALPPLGPEQFLGTTFAELQTFAEGYQSNGDHVLAFSVTTEGRTLFLNAATGQTVEIAAPNDYTERLMVSGGGGAWLVIGSGTNGVNVSPGYSMVQTIYSPDDVVFSADPAIPGYINNVQAFTGMGVIQAVWSNSYYVGLQTRRQGGQNDLTIFRLDRTHDSIVLTLPWWNNPPLSVVRKHAPTVVSTPWVSP